MSPLFYPVHPRGSRAHAEEGRSTKEEVQRKRITRFVLRPLYFVLKMTTDYARHEHHDFLGAARQALVDLPLQAALVRLTGTLLAGNRRGYAALADSSALRDHA